MAENDNESETDVEEQEIEESESRESGGEIEIPEDGGDPFDEDDPGPWPAHGFALPADAVTFGQSREPTFWPSEVVEAATEELIGKHLIRDHPKDPSIDDILGEVLDAEFIEERGLAWVGEIDDRETAQKAYRGRLSASPYLYRLLGPYSEEHDARVAREILKIRDLGVVTTGAGEGTEIEAGPHPELSLSDADGEPTATAEALSAAFSEEFTKFTTSNINSEDKDNNTNMQNDTDGDIDELRGELAELRERNDRLEAENDLLRQPYVEALTEGTPLSADDVTISTEELVERFGEDAEDVEESVGDDLSAAKLTAEPITGSEPAPADAQAEALSAASPEDVELARKLQDDLDMLGPNAPEQLKDDIADAVGVEDYEQAKELL